MSLTAGILRWKKQIKNFLVVENFIDGFEIPWGMCFLPNKDLLVSDRNGTCGK